MNPHGRRARPAGLLALTASLALTGCGGGGADDGTAARVAAAKAYAADVRAISGVAGGALATISEQADYRDAATAARSTGEYATAIRTTAGHLAGVSAPAEVAADHRALTALYRTTAERMDALARDFARTRDTDALAAKAQELSAEVQRLSTREAELRATIERDLPAAGPSRAASPSTAATSPAPTPAEEQGGGEG